MKQPSPIFYFNLALLDKWIVSVIIKLQNMKHKSKPSAVKNLRKLFMNSPESDSILLQEAYVAFGRDLADEKGNKNWVTNLMTHLKWHNLIIPSYSTSDMGRRVLKGIQLTMEGKRSLGRIESAKEGETLLPNTTYVLPNAEKEMNVSDIMNAIAKLKEKHPEFEIVFDMKLKGV